MPNILLKNGCFVHEGGIFCGDLFIEGETITQLGTDLGNSADVVIDLNGKHVFPGGIDAHIHMDVLCDDNSLSGGYVTDSNAAAIGGTTTIIDYVLQEKDIPLRKTIKNWLEKANSHSAVDFGFHAIITDASDETLGEIPRLIDQGITSFKLFMANNIALNDSSMIMAMKVIAENGGIACIHAENRAIIDFLQQQDASAGRLSPEHHAKSRPIFSETEAVNRVLTFSELTNCPTLIAHISNGLALDLVRLAKKRGLAVYSECCPHYLLLDESKYKLPGFESAKFIISPPLRNSIHNKQLWNGIKNGDIDIISSDHNGFTYEKQKKLGFDDYRKVPNGSPGIEHRFILLLSGCIKNNIPVSIFSNLISTNPAKLFGLYPRKGTLLPGSDADLVVVDINGKTSISQVTQAQMSDYTPFEGFECVGSIDAVFLRGKLVAEKGFFIGSNGSGVFLKRSQYSQRGIYNHEDYCGKS